MSAFSVAKAGADADQCEDAFAISEDRQKFALADGATDSAYPARWAQSLVRSFVDDFTCAGFETPTAMEEWLAPQRQRWHASVPWDSLPWYGQEKAERGAFATFLGCELATEAEAIHWRASAIGDTCLLHLRDTELLKTFPVANSAGFTNTPGLLGSSTKIKPRSIDAVRGTEGVLAAGETLVMATDALAHWWLGEIEQGRNALPEIAALGSTEDFGRFVEELRGREAIRNDDTTMILIHREPIATEVK